MVEITEYILVFAVTAMIGGFSLVIFGGALPSLQQTQGQAEADQISGAVNLAAETGSAVLIIPLANASLSCSGGSVELVTGGQSYTSGVAAGCDFSASGLNCMCRLSFSRGEQGVGVKVSQ